MEANETEDFMREERYYVVKKTDMEFAIDHGFIGGFELHTFETLVSQVDAARRARKRDKNAKLECIVVEHDWECYESAWTAVELEHARNSGNTTRAGNIDLLLQDDAGAITARLNSLVNDCTNLVSKIPEGTGKRKWDAHLSTLQILLARSVQAKEDWDAKREMIGHRIRTQQRLEREAKENDSE